MKLKTVKKIALFSTIPLVLAISFKAVFSEYENAKSYFNFFAFIFVWMLLWGVIAPVFSTIAFNTIYQNRKKRMKQQMPLFCDFIVIKEWEKEDE